MSNERWSTPARRDGFDGLVSLIGERSQPCSHEIAPVVDILLPLGVCVFRPDIKYILFSPCDALAIHVTGSAASAMSPSDVF